MTPRGHASATRFGWRGATALAAVLASVAAAPASDGVDHALGSFSAPFVEPVIYLSDGQGDEPGAATETDEVCIADENGYLHCKPTAGSMGVLSNGEVLFFNALEATENVENSIVAEYGKVAINDQTRVLDIRGEDGSESTWTIPTPNRADDGEESASHPLFPEPLNDSDSSSHNDAALFCSDLVNLGDGRLLAVGGTDYYTDPNIPGSPAPAGVVELEGTRDARIFDPETKTWSASGDMNYGRWYPSLVTLADGDVFVASGVTKLMKPLYTDRLEDSGTNVVQTETYDAETGTWTVNGEGSERSLPLYPRLHLLPNGDVYYDAAGQVYNPQGQSYDEALWNIAASYDPDRQTWTDLGVPGLGTTSMPGFRGSSFSIMLPLRPNEAGDFDRAEFLSAGGIMGATPGSYIATDQSQITSVTVDDDGVTGFETRETGAFNNRRWFSTGVQLPDGSVMAFSGADRDEVVGPGTGFPVTTAERFDPVTETWEEMADQGEARTYHNTAMLLPDGRVLVGGHSPISTLYGSNMTLPGGFSPQETRNPSFQIYSPPYVLDGDRPTITSVEAKTGPDPDRYANGDTLKVKLEANGNEVVSAMLVRKTAITHLIDGDQRSVELVDTSKGNGSREYVLPSASVAPNGPYLLFVRTEDASGRILPSEGFPITIG